MTGRELMALTTTKLLFSVLRFRLPLSKTLHFVVVVGVATDRMKERIKRRVDSVGSLVRAGTLFSLLFSWIPLCAFFLRFSADC